MSGVNLIVNNNLFRFSMGILGLALAGREPSNDFYSTPYWILRHLGRITPTKKGSREFQLFRDSLQRLAGVRYHSTAFYDPLRGEHREVSFGLATPPDWWHELRRRKRFRPFEN
ncbi:MAG: hypothetical protein KF851_03950 [Pirellulaceae bacterium]|nr:hypothetical protein [Pirellulaceae bacterium]